MKFLDEISKYLPCMQKNDVNVGKIIFKTAAITTAILAFVPTVIKINKGRGFDAYGLLSHVEYEKTTDEEGKEKRNLNITLFDLSRYGINFSKEDEKNEDSSCIEE